MKHLLILIIALLGYNAAKADCPSCWELRKVEITLKSGPMITCYIKWNESWLDGVVDTAVWKNRFPESLVAYYENLEYKWELEIYEEIYLIKNDSINSFVATKPETWFLSYNKYITPQELSKINADNLKEKTSELKKKGVIVYTFGY